jgi:Fur family zinc uptake transcriptional regulator
LESGRSATPQRMSIIHALGSAEKNLSAYELLGLLNDKGQLFNISTIYRVLDFWIEMGIVHKVDSSNTYLICNDNHTNHFHVLLQCSQCKAVEESCQISMQLSSPKSNKFAIKDGQVIEFIGLCQNCK